MRTALLPASSPSYTVGMFALAVDIGRPWNILAMANPLFWNTHSILFEVALCMSAYVMIALDFENLAPLLERFEDDPFPVLVRELAVIAKKVVSAVYPFGVALALLLPSMHQSSLGSLMLAGWAAGACVLANSATSGALPDHGLGAGHRLCGGRVDGLVRGVEPASGCLHPGITEQPGIVDRDLMDGSPHRRSRGTGPTERYPAF